MEERLARHEVSSKKATVLDLPLAGRVVQENDVEKFVSEATPELFATA